jgi:methylenetetrahydrofolate reductase (NADPH)
MSTQLCFRPAKIVSWIQELRDEGITLPIYLTIPGKVPTRRLVRTLKEFGVRSGVKYLRGQRGLARALLQREFSPNGIVDGLAPYLATTSLGIRGFYLVTLQEVAATEAWRQDRLRQAMLTDH